LVYGHTVCSRCKPLCHAVEPCGAHVMTDAPGQGTGVCLKGRAAPPPPPPACNPPPPLTQPALPPAWPRTRDHLVHGCTTEGKFTLTSSDIAFVEDISELLGVDHRTATQLFARFLRDHPLGKAVATHVDPPSPRHLAAVAQQYFDYRSFLVRLLQTILRIDCLGEREDGYHLPVGTFVESLLDSGLCVRVVDELMGLRAVAPPTIRTLHMFEDTRQYGPLDTFVQLHLGKWALQCIHEQVRVVC
jgi:hypothetical protein